jgi:hypothetical protein
MACIAIAENDYDEAALHLDSRNLSRTSLKLQRVSKMCALRNDKALRLEYALIELL